MADETHGNPELAKLQAAIVQEHMYLASVVIDGMAHLFRQYAAGNPTAVAPAQTFLQALQQAQKTIPILRPN